ncbi:MAG TPA: EVE domain-containing protein, partial [Ktedonobacterales bacterium]|nr:EVE domain-containing protein [Ktedonobacterales bacterium]
MSEQPSRPQAAATPGMFQYNPADYKLDESLQEKLTEPWTIYWGRSIVQLGERIYFMQSGGQRAAITAVGRVATHMYETPEEANKYLRYWVDVVYDSRVAPPLTRREMLKDDVLKAYGPYARGEYRANFALPPEVVARTARLVHVRLRPIEHSGVVGHKRIFVSHSHQDNDFGMRLVHDLRLALGGSEESVWYDTSGGLHVGDEWWRVIPPGAGAAAHRRRDPLASFSLQTAAPADRHPVALQTAVPVWTPSTLLQCGFNTQCVSL